MKETINKMKREPTVLKNIFANDASDKGLIAKICEELIHSKPGRQTTQFKKGLKDLSRHFSKKDIQMAQRHMKRCSTSLAIRDVN